MHRAYHVGPATFDTLARLVLEVQETLDAPWIVVGAATAIALVLILGPGIRFADDRLPFGAATPPASAPAGS